MRTRLKLRPGQRGTKKLLAVYGDQLLCVRYRYDEESRKRFKTVELIVDIADWQPRYASGDEGAELLEQPVNSLLPTAA
ncbi:MAG: hypothetical protein MUD01_17995 [Chloroflexaceae bacterium]|nr:hypothetical protein [Chloroflexaceae bacterium]